MGSSAIWSDTVLDQNFEDRSHRAKENTEVLYSCNRQAQRHRWCVEAQRIFMSFINIFVYFIPKQWFARFLKTFIRLLPKLSAICTLHLCRSLCLRHLREIVCFHLRALPLSVCLLYVVDLLYHSIFWKKLSCSYVCLTCIDKLN